MHVAWIFIHRKIHETNVPFSSKAPTLELYLAMRSKGGTTFEFPYTHDDLTLFKSHSRSNDRSSIPGLDLIMNISLSQYNDEFKLISISLLNLNFQGFFFWQTKEYKWYKSI